MYQVSCDGHPLLDWRDNDLILVNPRVKLAVNTVGEASFTLYKNHPHYDKLKRSKSVFEISDEIGVIFRGRMTGDTIDFDNGKAVDLEGVMAYFNDSVVRPFTYPDDFLTNTGYIAASKSGNVIQFFLEWLIDNHNEQVQEFQRFKLGKVTVTDPNNYLYRYSTEYGTTWEMLQTKLFNSTLGGYLCIRYEADGNYIDYLSAFELTNMQEIVFVENLMDLKNETDGTATYSAIIPLGTDEERTVPAGTVEGKYVDFEITKTVKGRLNIAGLPDGKVTDDIVKDGDTLYSISAVEQCGWIYAPIKDTTWNDVEKAETLLTKGIEWLKTNGMMSANTIEVTAVDLHFSDAEINSFRIYKNINVRSEPHGVVSTYPLSMLDIDLLNPQNTKITVGETRLTLIDKQYTDSTNTADKIVDLNNQGTLVGIVDVKTLYYLSTSEEELVGGDWVTEEPARMDGTYLWKKDVILYTDKSTYESPPTCATGAKGDPGIGVDVIETEFYLSNSNTTQSGDSWVKTMPQWSEGKYLWTRSVVYYSDGSASYTAPVCDSSWEAVNNLDNKLDQEEVFKRLTNNGALQGLYMENGKLYINASYIKTGELLADLIKSGKITSVDGTAYFDLDKGEFSVEGANGDTVVLRDGTLMVLDQDGFARIQMGHSATLGITTFALSNRSGQSLFNLLEQEGVLRLELPSTSELNEGQGYAGNPCWRRIGGVLMIAGATNDFYIDLTSEVKNALPIANGGTGASDRVNAMKNLSSIGMNPIASTAEDTVANWVAKGVGFSYFNKNVLNGQPTQRGFLVNKVQDTTVYQEWHTFDPTNTVKPTIYIRTGQGTIWVGGGWTNPALSSLVDYVTATGTSGVWTYWKFNSGLCIAMGTPTVTWGTQTQVITGQYRSTASLDLTGIFTSVMGGTCSNVHRYVNCFVVPSGNATPELWATTAAVAGNSLYSNKPMVVLFGKWK